MVNKNDEIGSNDDGHGEEGAVDFGWDEPEKKLSGRRKKAQKKAKLGTFGAWYSFLLLGIDADIDCVYMCVCHVQMPWGSPFQY